MDGSGQFDTSIDVSGLSIRPNILKLLLTLSEQANLSLDLANFDSGDVLENFDFDTFLHTTDDTAFNDFNMDFDHNSLLADGS